LNLEFPKNIQIFDEKGLSRVKPGSYKKEISKESSKFASSDTFRVFSADGAKEIRKIGKNLNNLKLAGIRNTRVRSVWYSSPFMRDFMAAPKWINHMSTSSNVSCLNYFIFAKYFPISNITNFDQNFDLTPNFDF